MENQRVLFDRDPEPWELDAAGDGWVASTVFPDAPRGRFDYRVPDAFRETLQLGARIVVPLGAGNADRVGYCVGLGNKARSGRGLKSIREVLDVPSLISPDVLRLAEWIANYYLCDLGPVLETVVPAGVRVKAGTRVATYYRLAPGVTSTPAEGRRLSAKQAQVVAILEQAAHPIEVRALARQAACTLGPIKELHKKKLIVAESRRELSMPTPVVDPSRTEPLTLNDDQQRALAEVRRALHARVHASILLFGVTGSGKTEVYLQAIQEVVQFGRQAIVLVPEISLTPQTCERFRARLRSVAVLHSHLTATERHQEWQRIALGEAEVVVGARSAIFAPVKHLGLIVIDEEHESSFKQDSAPRYHARDVARQRALQAGIPLLLGSATPSLESWYAATEGSARLVRMPHRVQNLPLPAVRIVDLRQESISRQTRGAISAPLHQAMDRALAARGQVILFLNRRGFSTHIQCPRCGEVVRCPDCDIPLTHHREGERARCHTCDFAQPTPNQCPKCRSADIRFGGLGTQRLEAEVKSRFPRATCIRMDADSMKRPGSHEAALRRFRDGETQILLGTQMIAKGLDFPNVLLVGVVNADTALHLPDFRAGERTFQLLTQVAGRTGRGAQGGIVILQTFSPDHFVIQTAARHDFEKFALRELPQRQKFDYPPYVGLTRFIVRGPDEQEVRTQADALRVHLDAAASQAASSISIMGPGPAPVSRIRGLFRYHLLLKGKDPEVLHELMRTAQANWNPPPPIQWQADVDALSLL